jgi:hypothetical protein
MVIKASRILMVNQGLRLLYMLCSERLRFENEEKEDLDEGFEIPDTPESSLASASYSGFLGVFWDGLVIICTSFLNGLMCIPTQNF